jgi:hypothetical protein
MDIRKMCVRGGLAMLLTAVLAVLAASAGVSSDAREGINPFTGEKMTVATLAGTPIGF